jgi:heterodisulfide reductase subunit C
MPEPMDPQERLLERFLAQGGDAVLRCVQCGTCSGSCPLAAQMDRGPRALFALIRDHGAPGLARALASDTLWQCVSCYSCTARCPREIPVTDLLYALKRLAVQAGHAPAGAKVPDLYRAFDAVVRKSGRVTDALLMARYGARHPGDALKSAPLALGLFRRGRLERRAQKTADPEALRRVLDAAGTGARTDGEDS